MRFLFFGFLIFWESFAAAVEFGGNERFLKSLSMFEGYQQRPRTCVKPPNLKGSCSETLSRLVDDEKQTRALIFEPSIEHCKNDLESSNPRVLQGIKDFKNPELLQQAFQSNLFNDLSEFSHESIKACLRSSSSKNNEVVSKFYYYTARLNEASGKIAQDQIIIDRYLGEKKQTSCPNEFLLSNGNDFCQKVRNCSGPEGLDQLSGQVQIEEEVYLQAKDAYAKLPKSCPEKDQNCQQEKKGLGAVIAGLLNKNPWFLNSDFNEDRKKYPVKNRLKKYFKTAQANLKKQQEQLETAALCLHVTDHEQCKDIDAIRETLALAAEFENHEEAQTPTQKILKGYMKFQGCIEANALDKNRASTAFKDAFANAGIGLAALPIGARWAAVKAGEMATSGVMALVAVDVAANVLSSRETWADLEKSCFSPKEIKFELKHVSQKMACEDTRSNLSAGTQESSSCLASLGLTTLSAVPFAGAGVNFLHYAQSTGLFKIANTTAQVVTTASKEAAAVATIEAAKNTSVGAGTANNTATKNSAAVNAETASGKSSQERRSSAVKESAERRHQETYKTTSYPEYLSEKIIQHENFPNFPEGLRLLEREKVDGSKALFYKYPEQLMDGSWRASVREIQIDDVTGALNANYPAGRDLFYRIASEKAGKAYFAFFDVGSLGFVNKNFKAGEAAGDRYLKGVADKIREIGAGKVTLARTGGDEFGLIIDEVDPVKAKALVQKIQEEIRKDLKGDAKKVFFEEKVARREDFQKEIAQLENQNKNQLTAEQKSKILDGLASEEKLVRVTREQKIQRAQKFKDLAKVQQPDVSIGLTQIGSYDSLMDLSLRAEEQAKNMKIATALKFGRSAEKYGSKATPNARPESMYLAPVADATPSPSWSVKQGRLFSTPNVDSLSLMKIDPKEEVLRFSEISVVRFEDELGRSIYKTKSFFTEAGTGKKIPVISEIPTRGTAGQLDGTHPEGQKLIAAYIHSQSRAGLGMMKLRSLKYLNYFKSGTQAGDIVLDALGEITKKNLRSYDLSMRLNGADSIIGLKDGTTKAMQKNFNQISEQLKSHPKVIELFAKENQALLVDLAVAQGRGDAEKIVEIQKRIQDLKNFDFDLQFQVLEHSEMSSTPTLKEIQKKFDDKFSKAN